MLKNAQIAFDSILANKFRAILTTLGIVFGVGAVISMLAIGKWGTTTNIGTIENCRSE